MRIENQIHHNVRIKKIQQWVPDHGSGLNKSSHGRHLIEEQLIAKKGNRGDCTHFECVKSRMCQFDTQNHGTGWKEPEEVIWTGLIISGWPRPWRVLNIGKGQRFHHLPQQQFSVFHHSQDRKGKKNFFYLVAISHCSGHLHCLMLCTSEQNVTPFCWPDSWHLFINSIWQNRHCHLAWIWTSCFKSGGAVSAGQVSFHPSQVCLVLYTSYRISEWTDILLVFRLDKL